MFPALRTVKIQTGFNCGSNKFKWESERGRTMTEKVLVDKALLNVKELRAYLGLGDTKVRELLNQPNSPFTVRIGNRLYANKRILDSWLTKISGTGKRVS